MEQNPRMETSGAGCQKNVCPRSRHRTKKPVFSVQELRQRAAMKFMAALCLSRNPVYT